MRRNQRRHCKRFPPDNLGKLWNIIVCEAENVLTISISLSFINTIINYKQMQFHRLLQSYVSTMHKLIFPFLFKFLGTSRAFLYACAHVAYVVGVSGEFIFLHASLHYCVNACMRTCV